MAEIKTVDITQIKYKPVDGEIIKDSNTGNYFIYNDGWSQVEMDESGLQLCLYDLNKSIVDQLPDLTEEELSRRAEVIKDYMLDKGNEYYMLYGKEISYFTLFRLSGDFLNKEHPGEVVLECLRPLGSIAAIDLDEANGGIEIWVKHENEATCLYLFPYDSGVVGIGV